MCNPRRFFLTVGLGMLLLPEAALSQNLNPSPAPTTRVMTALRLSPLDTIQVDGIVNEPVWEGAAAATDFVQQAPDNGAPATEAIEVRIVYDADRLILGVILHDSEPSRILGNQMQRDQSMRADDQFMLTLDTFLDGRSGYYFEINPAGGMGDGLLDPAAEGGPGGFGAGINRSWDGIWLARVRRTPTGWSAEIEIPFRTLNFDPTSQEWGINFQRVVARKNEDSLWTGHARNQGVARMSNAGRVVGLTDLSQGTGLDLKPYVVGSVESAPGLERPSALSTGDVGLDMFYNLTPALRANLSLNTDFAQTEVDQRQVNLTRFPLFFEEKRDFFLEGSSYFDFSRDPGRAITPFFSRRIGLDDSGIPRRIDVGAKLTGQVGAFDLGALQVRTADAGLQAGEDFSVLRVRRRAFEQSYVGALYTRRAVRAPGGADLHTAGLDFALRTANFRGSSNLELSGFSLWTSDPLDMGDSSAHGLYAQYPNDPVRASFLFRQVSPAYNPAVGFVERVGAREFSPDVGYMWRPADHPWFREFDFQVRATVLTDFEGRPLTRELAVRPFDVNFQQSGRFALVVTRYEERLEEDFEISDGVVLPAGREYEFTRYEISGSTPRQYFLSARGDLALGNFFSGDRRDYLLALSVRPRRGVEIVLEAEHNVLALDEGSFDTDVFRLNANTQFSPWLSLANNLQYDSVSQSLGWQMRLRWIRRPGNDLYLVYSHNWRQILEAGERRLATFDNRLATKLVYTLRF